MHNYVFFYTVVTFILVHHKKQLSVEEKSNLRHDKTRPGSCCKVVCRGQMIIYNVTMSAKWLKYEI